MGLGIDDDKDEDDRHVTFTEIVTRYIVDGAPDEVNIRYELSSGSNALKRANYVLWRARITVIFTPGLAELRGTWWLPYFSCISR